MVTSRTSGATTGIADAGVSIPYPTSRNTGLQSDRELATVPVSTSSLALNWQGKGGRRPSDADPAVEAMPSLDRPARQVDGLLEELRKALWIRRRGEHVRCGPYLGHVVQ